MMTEENTRSLRNKRIDVGDEDELYFWMREFGVSADELYVALRAVGTSARLVGLYLEENPRPKPPVR